MNKILLIILGAYIIYYAAMLIYDLFIAKDDKIVENLEDEIDLTEVLEEEDFKKVDVDQVESIQTPDSFTLKDEIDEAPYQSKEDLDELEERYKQERELEEFDTSISTEKKEVKEEEKKEEESIKNDDPSQKDTEKKSTSISSRDNLWTDIVNKANTSVQVVENIEGHVSYRSTIGIN